MKNNQMREKGIIIFMPLLLWVSSFSVASAPKDSNPRIKKNLLDSSTLAIKNANQYQFFYQL